MERAGRLVNNLSGELSYMSFKPTPLQEIRVEQDQEMIDLLIKASSKIEALNAISDFVPNKDLFLAMYVRKEALVSSQIEGTQCTLEDSFDLNNEKNTNPDISEVINYIKAVEVAKDQLKGLPLCNRLIKSAHKVMMNNVRGKNKTPGEFRKTQNWVGGTSLENARYVPPNVEDMNLAMSDLEKYMNEENGLNPLIKIALIHYQFETIHPFLDGNGRIGRLLISLYLMDKGIISSPVLYPSCYLKANQIEYYDRLTEVRKKDNYEQWIKFFLEGLYQTAKDAIETINKLTKLHEETVSLFDSLSKTKKNKAIEVLSSLEEWPITDIYGLANRTGLSYMSIASYVDYFLQKGILKISHSDGKRRIYFYEKFINIIRKDT